MNIFRKNNGFTLIEIVVVIAIMGVLSAVIYSSFDASRQKSRDQKRVSDISTIQLALEQYFQKNGIYPSDLNILTQTPKYISEIPKDPTSGNPYTGNYIPITKTFGSNNCVSYQLWAKFERNNEYLNSKKGFNSLNLLTTQNLDPKSLYECGSGHNKIDAFNATTTYDVMPY